MPTTGPVPSIASHQLVVLLTDVGLLLILAFLLGRLAMRLKMPAIVGELCAGVLVGPSVLAHLSPTASAWLLPHSPAQMHLLDAVAEIGLLLLVGITGIQIDLGLIRRRSGTAAITGISGLVIPLAAGFGLALLLPTSLIGGHSSRDTFALFIGVAIGRQRAPGDRQDADRPAPAAPRHRPAHPLRGDRRRHRSAGSCWPWCPPLAAGKLAATGVGRLLGGLAVVILVAVVSRPLVRAGLRAHGGPARAGAADRGAGHPDHPGRGRDPGARPRGGVRRVHRRHRDQQLRRGGAGPAGAPAGDGAVGAGPAVLRHRRAADEPDRAGPAVGAAGRPGRAGGGHRGQVRRRLRRGPAEPPRALARRWPWAPG